LVRLKELLKIMAGVSIVHVPYKGVVPASTDLISGQVQLLTGDLNTLMPHVRSGRARALAVTSSKRSSLVPELPTVGESGVPGYEVSGWFGVLAPGGTPQGIIKRLNDEIVKGLAASDVRQRLAGLGGEVAGGSPEDFSTHLRGEIAKWGKLIRAIGLKGESGA
jgi:tripartite-type tricarboxylate transporter receptor subunit TctC